MKLYHGTDLQSGKKIIKNGFGTGLYNTIWDCSNPLNTYLIDSNYDDGNGLDFAIEAAQISCAIKDSKDTSIIVFEINIDEDELDNDSSCRDYDGETEMEDSYQINSEYLNYLIASRTATVKVHNIQNAYIPYLRVFYIPYNNPFLSIDDDLLFDAIKVVNNSKCFLEDIRYLRGDDEILNLEDIKDSFLNRKDMNFTNNYINKEEYER